MDVWRWVQQLQQELREQGQAHVAELIEELPGAVVESDPRADALAPELIAASRAMGHPWLEIYARHWHLQYLVGTLNQGTIALQYATESLERAHRDDTKDCPQSVCITQDLSMTYESIDSLSFAPEREAVCREALEKLSPHITCFDCIHRELCDAIADQGRPQEALDLSEKAIQAMLAIDDEPSPGFLSVNARLHTDLGRPDLAVQLCEQGEENVDDEPATKKAHRRLQWARASRLLGNVDDAQKWFPSPDMVLQERTLSSLWALEALEMVRAGVIENSIDLASALQILLEHSDRVGSLRTTVDIAFVHAMLAAERGIAWVGDAALSVGERTLPQLRVDHGARDRLAAARSAIAAVPELALPVPANEVADYVENDDSTVEQDIAWLRIAYQHDPNDARTATLLGIAYAAAGQHTLLRDHFAKVAETPAATDASFISLVRQLAESDMPASTIDPLISGVASRLLASSEPDRRFSGHRIAAELAWVRDRYSEAAEHANAALAIHSDAQTRHLLASASKELKDFATAKTQLEILCAAEEEPTSLSWDLMTAATCVGDWETVRAEAARLELDVDPGTGPIDEQWSLVRVLLLTGDSLAPWSAVRTGPVTARIYEVAHPQLQPQYFGAVVVFDATLLNGHEQDEAGDDFVPLYPGVHMLERSTARSWVVDGADPGPDQWFAFRDALRAYESNGQPWGVWNATWEDYEVVDSGTDTEFPGMFCFVAAPADLAPIDVHRRLTELTKDWEHKPAWVELARAASTDLEVHQARARRYGL